MKLLQLVATLLLLPATLSSTPAKADGLAKCVINLHNVVILSPKYGKEYDSLLASAKPYKVSVVYCRDKGVTKAVIGNFPSNEKAQEFKKELCADSQVCRENRVQIIK